MRPLQFGSGGRLKLAPDVVAGEYRWLHSDSVGWP